MFGSILAWVVIPLVIAGLVRWTAARRRRGLATGRAVHFRGRLDDRRGRLLADPRLDIPVFLFRDGSATLLPRGGESLDATVLSSHTGQTAFEKVSLRYRTPDGATARLSLGTHDARTVGAWLAEKPTDAPGRVRRRLPLAPPWAALALIASLLVVLAAADVALLGTQTTATVVRVHPDEDACTVRWDGGTQQALVDCDTATVRVGDTEPELALPWPFLGEAVDPGVTSLMAAVAGGGFGLLGLAGALVLTPWACARRVRRALVAGPAVLTTAPSGPGTGAGAGSGVSADPGADPASAADDLDGEWPTLGNRPTYGSLAAVARHAERHRPGLRVSAPRRGPGRTSLSPRVWVCFTVFGTGAWWFLALSANVMFDDNFHLDRWWYVVPGAVVAVVSLARIGWFAVDRSSRCRPVLRAARGEAPDEAWEPMRYVRLNRERGEMALVLFPVEGGEVAAPRYVQRLVWCRGSERRTIGGPAPVGEALVHDSGRGLLVSEIDGVRYLPGGLAVDLEAQPGRGRDELRSFAESHRRRLDRR